MLRKPAGGIKKHLVRREVRNVVMNAHKLTAKVLFSFRHFRSLSRSRLKRPAAR